MENIVLRAKHWQVFLFYFVIFMMMNFSITDAPSLSAVIKAVGYILYFGWFMFLGNKLFPLLPRNTDYSLSWFLIDIILVAAFWSIALVSLGDGTYHAEGLLVLPILYVLFAMLHVPWILANVLVSIEKRRKPEFGFYFGTLLLFILWPVGVWSIQPRLNKIWKIYSIGSHDR